MYEAITYEAITRIRRLNTKEGSLKYPDPRN